MGRIFKTFRDFPNRICESFNGTWTQPKLSDIISGKRAITEAIALDLADALGTSAEFWINLQKDVGLWDAKKKHKKLKLFPRLHRSVKKNLTPH